MRKQVIERCLIGNVQKTEQTDREQADGADDTAYTVLLRYLVLAPGALREDWMTRLVLRSENSTECNSRWFWKFAPTADSDMGCGTPCWYAGALLSYCFSMTNEWGR